MRYKGCPSPENPACASSHIDVRHYGKNWDNAGLSTSELVELAGDNTIEVFASGYLCSNCVRAVRLALTWDGEKYDANDETIIPNLNNDESARSEERRAYDMHQMSALRVHCVSREQFYASVREQCRVCVQIASTAALDQVSLEISFRPFTGYNIELDDKKEMSIEFFFGTSTHEVARFFTFKVQDFKTPFYSPLLYRSTDSVSSWTLIRKWLDDCLSNHDSCRSTLSGHRHPTRLLDVGKSGPTIRLETEFSADFNEHYLTLSHCWGGADVPILTVGTVQKFSAGIQIISLPKTFRDAVKATRELGIRYLWIDSICIIQDSQFDWRAESAKMREVYSNALCNLAALGGENSHSGLFFDRSLEQLMHLRPLWIHKRIPGSPFVSSYKLIDRWKQLEKFEKSPLVKRAWVMQERFLAPRVVYFGREELYWECKSRMASESLQEDCCERCYPSYFLKTQYKHFTDAGFRNNWYEILDSYTQMQLTYPSDILIALSGIAKDFQQFNLDEYVVGMWKRSLLSDLCWEVDMPGRPSTYRAPSWSWASLHGRVTITNIWKDTSNQAYVLDIKILKEGDDPTVGVLEGCILTIQGQLYPMEVHIANPGNSSLYYQGRKIVKRCQYTATHGFSYPNTRNVTFLRLFEDSTTSYDLYGILLSPSGNRNGEYVRVGMAVLSGWGVIYERYPIDGDVHPDLPCLDFHPIKGHTITII